jgi:hypothetical protein
MTLIMFFEFLIGLTDVYIAGKVGKEIQAAYGFVIQLYFIKTSLGFRGIARRNRHGDDGGGNSSDDGHRGDSECPMDCLSTFA